MAPRNKIRSNDPAESKPQEGKGHPLGKTSNYCLKMVCYRLNELLQALKPQIIAEPPEDKRGRFGDAMDILQHTAAQSTTPEAPFRATRCHRIEVSKDGNATEGLWILAAHREPSFMGAMRTLLGCSDVIKAKTGVEISEDHGPSTRPEKTIASFVCNLR